jgi:hypothetical protein
VKARRGNSWRQPAQGVTLVEVLAGSALLATLLVSILVARGQLAVQARRADNRMQACAILDDLLAGFWASRGTFPRSETGDVPNHDGWRWTAGTVPNEGADAMNADVVAVEVFAPGEDGATAAARVEILLSREKPEDAAPEAGGDNEKSQGPDAG